VTERDAPRPRQRGLFQCRLGTKSVEVAAVASSTSATTEPSASMKTATRSTFGHFVAQPALK